MKVILYGVTGMVGQLALRENFTRSRGGTSFSDRS